MVAQYAITVGHSPQDCPFVNKDALDSAKKLFAELLYLARKLNVKILIDAHLNPSHDVFILLEAPSKQAVKDLLLMTGIAALQKVIIHTVTPIIERVNA